MSLDVVAWGRTFWCLQWKHPGWQHIIHSQGRKTWLTYILSHGTTACPWLCQRNLLRILPVHLGFLGCNHPIKFKFSFPLFCGWRCHDCRQSAHTHILSLHCCSCASSDQSVKQGRLIWWWVHVVLCGHADSGRNCCRREWHGLHHHNSHVGCAGCCQSWWSTKLWQVVDNRHLQHHVTSFRASSCGLGERSCYKKRVKSLKLAQSPKATSWRNELQSPMLG